MFKDIEKDWEGATHEIMMGAVSILHQWKQGSLSFDGEDKITYAGIGNFMLYNTKGGIPS